VTEAAALIQLHDLDLLLGEARDPKAIARLKKLGLAVEHALALERARTRLLAGIDRRWLNHYQRALHRYGRAVAVVRDRVCQGCFITLPTSISPGLSPSLTLCESCGRILYWP
jgi:predicted  nucleic acid-binding Zn-ribbon protein